MDKIRYGIIGFGAQGSSYCNILTGTPAFPGFPAAAIPPHCELGAVADIDPAKREAVKAKFPNIPVFEDYKEMIASGLVDAVITTVPHYLHHEMAIYAMEHGMHVIGEKPAGVRASDVQKMLDCAAAHPEVKLGIMFNQRTNKLYQKIREIVKSGELGEIRRSNWIINTWWRPDSYYRQSDWRATWGGEGGGVLVNQAPHQLDLWQWICGTPVEVTSININGAHRDIGVENDVTIVTKYANGATGSFITCTHDAIGTDRLEIDFDGGKIVVENSVKATVYRMAKDGKRVDEKYMNDNIGMMELAMLTRSNGGGGLYEVEEFSNNDAWGVQHGTVMANFASHVLFGTELLAPGSDGIMGVRMANCSQLSAWTGKTVSYPCNEAEYNAKLNELIAAEGKFPVRD